MIRPDVSIGEIDGDPVLSALFSALNLQSAVAYYCASDAGSKLDGDWHFDKIREAIDLRIAEIRARNTQNS